MSAVLAALLLQAAPAAGAPDLSKLEPLSAAALEASVGHLASDALEGRRTGEPGYELAARWVATQLEAAGIEPAGDDGTFFQDVPFHKRTVTKATVMTVQGSSGRRIQESYEEFRVLAGAGSWEGTPRRGNRKAPEEAGGGLLVEGRTSRLRARRLTDRSEAVVFVDGEADPRLMEARTPRPERGRPSTDNGSSALVIAVSGGLRDRLLDGWQVEVSVEARDTALFAPNVLGRIPGTDLAGSVVLVSAHLDHLGRTGRPDKDGDDIANGADDDASGCAAILEVARHMATEPAPRRTLLFLFASGEEIGLVGTQHWIEQPTVPLESLAANINVEMIGRPDPLAGGPGGLWLTGHDLSTLRESWTGAGLKISPDLRPEQNFFRRSDNYALALRGVVAHTLSSYNLHTDYHRVSDEADTLDYAHMEAAVATVAAAVRHTADEDGVPAWNQGADPSQRRR